MGRLLCFEYEQGMRQRKSVHFLERLRKRIVYDWEKEACDRTVSLSEALMMAIHYDHIEMVEYLLSTNAVEATRIPKWSRSHLICAVDKNNTIALEKLLQYTMTAKGDYDDQLASKLNADAADNGRQVSQPWGSTHLPRGSLSLPRGLSAPPRGSFLPLRRPRFTGTPHVPRVRRYADQKGRCRIYGMSKSALHVACKLGRVQCLHLLLSYGADPSINDLFGFNPLEYCLTRLCQGRWQVRSPEDPIFECVQALLLALPHFQLSRYILPSLLQFVASEDDLNADDQDSVEDYHDLSVLSAEDQAILRSKLKETVREALLQMNNARKLQHLCRNAIRNTVVKTKLCPGIYNDLPMPKLLKSYIEIVDVTMVT